MNTIRQYIQGQVVELHLLRMEDSSTWLLLQKDGRSSGKCYHVTPAQAELLPRRLSLRTEVLSAHPYVCHVSLPKEGAIHHRYLTFTHQELARCDFAAQEPLRHQPTTGTLSQLEFNL